MSISATDFIDKLAITNGMTRGQVLKHMDELRQRGMIMPLSSDWNDGLWITECQKVVGGSFA